MDSEAPSKKCENSTSMKNGTLRGTNHRNKSSHGFHQHRHHKNNNRNTKNPSKSSSNVNDGNCAGKLTENLKKMSLSSKPTDKSKSKKKSPEQAKPKDSESILKELISKNQNINDDEFLLKLVTDSSGFFQLLHARQNDDDKVFLILQIFAKVTTLERSFRLNQFIVTILPAQATSSHFLTSQLMLFISNLQLNVQNDGQRHMIYLDAIHNLLVFLKFLLSLMLNHVHATVKNIVTLLISQVNFINSQSPSKDIFPEIIIVELNELMEIIDDYELKLKDNGDSKAAAGLVKPTDDFREIPVCPTPFDLFNCNKPFLQRNVIVGKYGGVEQYLDTQFRLLREDFIRSLREGIAEYKQAALACTNKKEIMSIRKAGDLNIYNDVRVTGAVLQPNDLVYQITFDTTQFKQFRWQASKRLITGSLICLSSDSFNTFRLATVAGNRDEKLLAQGRFQIKFEFLDEHEALPDIKPETVFTAAESSVFFEAYRHNLDILKTFNESNFPFKDYIIDVHKEIKPPKYVEQNTEYDLSALMRPFIKIADDEVEKWVKTELETNQQHNDNKRSNEYQIKKDTFLRTHFKKIKHKHYCNALRNTRQCPRITVLNDASWLAVNTNFGLNESQLMAFKAALTKEFVIIQGPPGTGKTYVGLRIVQALLENHKPQKVPNLNKRPLVKNIPVNQTKILVVCYTNHALDQFLQGILSFCDEVVRVGGNSHNDLINAYNLSSVRKRIRKSKGFPCDIASKRINAYEELKKMKENIERFEIFKKDIERYPAVFFNHNNDLFRIIKEFYQPHFAQFDFNGSLMNWLGYEVQNKDSTTIDQVQPKQQKNEVEPGKARRGYELPENLEEIEDDLDKVDVNYTETLRTIADDDLFEDENVDVGVDEESDMNAVAQKAFDEENAKKNGYRFRNGQKKCLNEQCKDFKYFQNDFKLAEMMSQQEALLRTDFETMNNTDRLKLFKFWLTVFFERRAEEISAERQRFNIWLNVYKERREKEDEFIVQQSRVIAMTTTGAAKYRHIINKIKPNILVVEEAAEVLEAHIITALCESTEHVILIGDHQQLKPNPAVYDLARNYKLDVSLFERMVMNQLPCYQLKEQHRMHPNISTLLVPHIYTELVDHSSVSKYEKIRGMPSNILFFNHNKYEEQLIESLSHKNVFEADFVVQLAHYLLLQGYKTSQIIILTTYFGQLLEINQHIRRHNSVSLKNVRVSVVDNFQGEENDIIILSFVRSNAANKIGFLETTNRINVALSRAKMALYCIGNFDGFCEKSDIWKNVVQKVKEQRAFGDNFEFVCQNHPDQKNTIRSARDFSKMPAGGCLRPCHADLECSHICPHVCHIIDLTHQDEYKCMAQCDDFCTYGHRCSKTCHFGAEDCSPCQSIVTVVGKCGHTINIKCGYRQDEDHVLSACRTKCENLCSFGHKCSRNCHFSSANCGPCLTVVEIKGKCGHLVQIECGYSTDDELILLACTSQCKQFCSKGHQCPKRCHLNDADCGPCQTYIDVTGKCGHSMEIECSYSNDENRILSECNSSCGVKLVCGHMCGGKCGSCKQGRFHRKCYEQCERILFCGHKCSMDACGAACVSCTWRNCFNHGFKCFNNRRSEYLNKKRLQFDKLKIPNDDEVWLQFKNIGKILWLPFRQAVLHVELERKKVILNYLIKLHPVMETMSRVKIYQEKLMNICSVEKYVHRMNQLLNLLEYLDNYQDYQRMSDIDNEMAILQIVFHVLSCFIFKVVSDADVVLLKALFNTIPDLGPCSQRISEEFVNVFKEKFPLLHVN